MPSEQTAVVVTRTLAAAPETVFDAWLDAAHAGAWLFATPTGRIVEVAIDPVVGGTLRVTDRRDGEDVLHVGTFLELERPGRLVFEFGVPKYSDARDRVTVTMTPAEKGCDVTLCHALTPGMEQWADSVRQGWTGILDGLARELARAAAPAAVPRTPWHGGFPGAVTICDAQGVILEMNEKSAKTFESDGGRDLVGTNLLDCHPEPSRSLVAGLLARPRVNAYTIEKRGVRKLIYQAPWFEGGVCQGLVELSLEIPPDMPHFIRQG